MRTTALRMLDYFPLWALLLIPAGWFAAYGLHATDARDAMRVAVYLALALSATDLAVGHAVVISTYRDGKAPAWLVAFAYSKISQTSVYYSVVFLVIRRLAGNPPDAYERLAYAMLGAASVASVLAAVVFTACWLAPDGFRYRIRPWPWQVVRDLRKTSRGTSSASKGREGKDG